MKLRFLVFLSLQKNVETENLELKILADTDTGTCGDKVTYTFYGETLTISESGTMSDDSYNSAPWYYCRNSIKSVVIEDSVQSIGSCAFSGCRNLTSVPIPGSVTSIGVQAFLKSTPHNSQKRMLK